MSLTACAEMVQQGDPVRFAATMAAPVSARENLWPLYAVNLEIARAPWASAEPVVAEMRLQWWSDTLGELAAGQDRTGHPVTEALAPVLRADPEIARLLQDLAEARRWDCWAEPFADRAAFDAYLDATAGNLMWAAARALGADAGAEGAVRDFAWGAGLARWFAAAAALEARGRVPFTDPSPPAVAMLARDGLRRIARARAQSHAIERTIRLALWPGLGAEAVLRQVTRAPDCVAAGRLGLSDFRRRGTLLWLALTGGF